MTMTQNTDFKLPFNSLKNYVPTNLRNPVISSLIDNLFDRFLTHDESVPLYGYVGRKPTSPDDRAPRVPQSSVERDINSIVPVLSFKLGADRHAFTIEDLIRKAEAIGISPGNLQWLYSQGNNFLPPINLDKFTNFFNYYWVAKAIPAKPELAWNPDLAPEYYVIAAPLVSDLSKLNVVAASTGNVVLTGTGFNKLNFEVLFTSPTEFKITPIGTLGLYKAMRTEFSLQNETDHINYIVQNGQGHVVKLIEFDITRDQIYDEAGASVGLAAFEAGDKFVISPEFLTRNYTVNFIGSPGIKGKIARVKALNDYQKIDGVQLEAGDRVLIKNNSAADDGIYVVSTGVWQRAVDFDGENKVAGARVYVQKGQANANKMFVSVQGGGGFGFQVEPEPSGGYQSNTNEWQEGNYWVSGEALSELGLARADAIQAVRPIIEYSGDIQLNGFVKDGKPSDSGKAYRQIKTEFNQLPMFDLYRYDGTHSNRVSSVFYYEEDLTAELDLKLQKRIKKSTNDSADFIFNHGMADENDQQLFVKRNGSIKSIWHAGYTGPVVVDQTFDGAGNGKLENVNAHGFTQQQVWTLTALTASTFKVKASKMPTLPSPFDVVSVGEHYDNGDVSFIISPGSTAFAEGDTFIFRIGNLETPRYVYRDEDDAIFDRFGGPARDMKGEGAWQIPRTFYNNPYNDNRSAVPEGVLYSHFRGILTNQIEGQPVDNSFGGSIKLWSEQQTLLASLLMQRDMTPISMIDLSQRQYEMALNAVRDIFEQNIVQFIGDNGPISSYDQLEKLLKFVEKIRSHDNDVRTVLFDSTAPVVGFPATLPQLGIAKLVKPTIEFDSVLGRTVMIHHDGHMSLLFDNDINMRQAILGNLTALQVKRSDGTYTSAISFTEPTRPYCGELWQSNGQTLGFNVVSDSSDPPTTTFDGALWYRRETGELYRWEETGWVVQPDPRAAWAEVNFAGMLNSLLLLVETRLYEGMNPNARKYDFDQLKDDAEFNAQLKKELFSFAAMNGYDPLGSDYDPADAFTWNYSGSVAEQLPAMPEGKVPARWFDLLKAHQSTFENVIPTERPNLEPWKLFGFNTDAEWWNSISDEQRVSYAPVITPEQLSDGPFVDGGNVAAIQTVEGITALFGLPLIDGVTLKTGDRVLLAAETNDMNNGVWVVSSSAWSKSDVNAVGVFVTVLGGKHKGTKWIMTDKNDQTQKFAQVRAWSNKMWEDVKFANPGLKLSVDTLNDTLLPPYVNPSHFTAENALMTGRPSSAAQGYMFGQGSPVETVWGKSLEFGYSQARALFRYDPLAFLGFAWGFNWVEVDGILYDGLDMNMPGHKRFKLHGDQIDLIDRSELSVQGLNNAIVTYDGYCVGEKDDKIIRRQNFTVKRDGQVLGYVNAGETATVGGLTFTIVDEGRPFRVGDRFEIANGKALFVPTVTLSYLGFGQTFTNALRETSIDTESSFAIAAFREWEVNMGYRAGGLVATDDLQVFTDAETLSESAYDLMFKKNQIARNEWLQALRVSVTNFGASVKKDVGVAPKGNGEDWTFRIEGYNPRFTSISYYQMSLGKNPIDFHALGKAHTDLVWFQPTVIDKVTTTNLPITIKGIQNVVNFLFGYSKYAESKGWEFNQLSEFNIDAETGRSRNFQLEIEKFVDRCYAGLSEDQGHVVNPFIERVWFNQETGLMSEFVDTSLFDISGHPGVFDTLGVKFSKADLDVVRSNTQSSIGAAAPMFSVHVQLDEFEHLFIFNNYSQPSTGSGLLYDPFSGARVATYKFNGRKQATNTMRPEFGGHFLVGNEVHQNLQASTDNIANLYDSNRAFENETTTRHALALLGFNNKDYFNNLDISEKTQFNFWRGLIQAKGTNLSIDAYLNNNRFDDAKVDEYWAYKLAEYGDARTRSYPELKLSVNDALTQFTQLQFDNDSLSTSGFDTILSFDESRWFSIDDMDQDVKFSADVVGRHHIDAVAGQQYTLPFVADALGDGDFTQLNATTIVATEDGELNIVGYGPARPRFNPVKVFNYVDHELVAEIPIWHPAAGQHTPAAMENINIISDINPARYNYSKQALNNNTYDPLRPWGAREVGRTWFDTRNLKYLPYFDKNIFGIEERLSRWGTLADFASVDVYEWVQSSVPPSEYDALAAEQQGDAGLDAQTKAAGQVAGKQTYTRNRNWEARPIAWSYSASPKDVDWEATPPFPAGSTDARINLENGLAVLDKGTFSEYKIVAGMRLGAWNNDPINPKPLSEYVIENKFLKKIDDVDGGTFVSATSGSFKVTVESSGSNLIVGHLLFSNVQADVIDRVDEDISDVTTYLRVIELDSGRSEVAVVNRTFGTFSAVTGEVFEVELPEFGLLIKAQSTESKSFNADDLAKSIVDALRDSIVIHDAVAITPIIEAPYISLSNALDDADLSYGWRVWNVPTQAQLNADTQAPVSSWKPYLGDFRQTSMNLTSIQEASDYAKAPLTLKNGIKIERYKSTWTDWNLLQNVILNETQSVTGPMTFTTLDQLDPARVSVYVNGIAQLKAAFTIQGKVLTVNNAVKGSTVTVIIRKYEPTAAELTFNPDVVDDLSIQRQYSEDYEYVSLPVRDREGALNSTVYFFWVKNKTTPAVGKKLSVQAVAQQLRDGPPNFLTFQNMSKTMPFTYDAITLSGLSYIVTKNDSFKLRFTRNFTLRDDPQELDLKNVHTEWALMRPGQKQRIPESLWRKLTDSVSGLDSAGNTVPAIRRSLYDERNNTKTQFGFGPEQTLAPAELLRSSIIHTILNTKLVDEGASIVVPDYITFLDLDNSEAWFETAEQSRKTMTDIWNQGTVAQVNEIFFGALEDVVASNYELSDIFKTSRLSAYSIKVVPSAPIAPTYE